MSILLFIVFGFVVGLIARALMPGRQGMGMLMTAGLGIAGSFLGGFVGSLISGRPLTEFNTTGLIGSVIGALAVLGLMGAMSNRRLAVLGRDGHQPTAPGPRYPAGRAAQPGRPGP